MKYIVCKAKFFLALKGVITISKPPIPFYITRFLAKGLFNILFNIEVKGKDNIPKDDNYIIIANHLNWSDPFFIFMLFPAAPKIIFIAENEGIYDNEKKKKFINIMGKPIIPIHRDQTKSRIKAIRSMIRIVKKGNNLAVFPEGRLGHAEGQIFPFYIGVFSVAKKLNVPIIPVAFSGTKELSFRNPIKVNIGELTYCKKEESDEDFAKRIALKMRNLLPEYPGEGHFPNTMNWLTDLFQEGLRPFNGEYTLIIDKDDSKEE